MSKATHFVRHPSKIVFYLALLLILSFSMLLPQCAQIAAPTGGSKDSIPPVLLSSTPPDSTLNFNSQTITFEFDEFIQLKNLQKQLLIAPNPKKKPKIKSKLRTLTVTWPDKDSLMTNTTYIINMGNAIADLNEGNQLENFRYVFSTGDYLDSLEIQGKVIDARSGLPDSTALVMLYTQQFDSVVSREKPLYYIRCKGDGSFRFQNLPHDTFKVFALIDGNGDFEYNDSTEAIAFLKHPLILDSTRTGLLLSLFKEKETKKESPTNAPSSKQKGEKERKLKYSTSLRNKQQELLKPLELTFSDPLKSLDSNAMTLQEDTTHRTVKFQIEEDTSTNKIVIHYNWKENTPYRLILDSAFAIDTSGLAYAKKDTLKFITKSKADYGSLTLHFDTTLYKGTDSLAAETKDSLAKVSGTREETDSSFVPTDSLAKKVDTLTRNDSSTKAQTDSTILPQDSSIAKQDSSIAKLDSSIAKQDSSIVKQDSSIAKLDSIQTDSLTSAKAKSQVKKYPWVIELYSNKEMIYSAPLQGDTWEKGYLNPGKYTVRVVQDVNNNGKWNRGCYYCEEKRQPEKVYTIPEEFTIRANWDNDVPDLKVKFEESSVD